MSTLKLVSVLATALITLTAHAQRTATPATTDLSTDTHSSTFATAEERLEFLDRYLNFPTQPKDAQFTLVYHDNSRGFPPGPSDWDLQIVVWLEPGELPLWLKDMQGVEASDGFDWVSELSPNLSASLLDKAQFYEAPGKRAALLEKGVLALWYSTY